MCNGELRGFVTGGTWCLDRNRLVELWPAEDGLAEISEEETRGGGSACNLAFGIRKLDPGLPVETIGLTGDDEEGRVLREAAAISGVDCAQLATVSGMRTHVAEAYTSRESGRRTHIFRRGVSDELTPDYFDFTAREAASFILACQEFTRGWTAHGAMPQMAGSRHFGRRGWLGSRPISNSAAFRHPAWPPSCAPACRSSIF